MKNKFIFTLAVTLSLNLMALPTNAVTEVFGGAAGYNSITGGSISETGNTCNVNVTGQGAVTEWNTLNVPTGKTLNFNFNNAGQYALNNVLNNMTEIAGTLSSTGAAGTVIIANPNGVVCTGSADIQMGASSLVLTTHQAQLVEDYVRLQAATGTDGNYHGVVIAPNVKTYNMGNLTIASLGIDIDGADISTKGTKLVTSDGLNYVLASADVNNITNEQLVGVNNVAFGANAPSETATASVKIANTAIKATDGKIYLTSTKNGEAVNLTDTNIIGKTEISSNGDVDVKASTSVDWEGYMLGTPKGVFTDDVKITAKGNINLSSTDKDTALPFMTDLFIAAENLENANAENKVTLNNVRIMNGVDQNTTIKAKDVTIKGFDNTYEWDWDYSILGNVDITANNITTEQTQILGHVINMNATNNINILGTMLGSDGNSVTTLTANQITLNESDITPTYAFAPAAIGTLNLNAQNVLLANNYLFEDFSPVLNTNVDNLTITNFGFKNATINDVENLAMTDSKVYGDLTVAPSNTSSIAKISDINLDQTTIDNKTTIVNANDVTLKEFTTKNLEISNVTKWEMEDTKIIEDVVATKISEYVGKGTNTSAGTPFEYVVPVSQTTNDIDSSVASYVDAMNTGNAPDFNAGNGPFIARAFAAEEEEDNTDYKEEFLRRYVKEDKDGKLYTVNTFKAE